MLEDNKMNALLTWLKFMSIDRRCYVFMWRKRCDDGENKYTSFVMKWSQEVQ